jgi:hypothetical protein
LTRIQIAPKEDLLVWSAQSQLTGKRSRRRTGIAETGVGASRYTRSTLQLARTMVYSLSI